MSKILIFFLVCGFVNHGFAESFSRIIVSQQNQNDKERLALKSTLDIETQKYVFEMCTESAENSATSSSDTTSFKITDCRTIGSQEGYTREQIAERTEKLKSDARMDRIYDVAQITLGTLAGAAAGAFIGSKVGLAYYNITQPQHYHVGSYEVLGVALGGLAVGAVGGGVLTHYLVWGSDAETQMDFLKMSTATLQPEPDVLRIELDGIDMLSALRELNITLAGIF